MAKLPLLSGNEEVKMGEEDQLIVVYAGASVDSGYLRGLLEDAGIRTYLHDEIMGTLAPWYVAPGGAGAVKVLIAKEDLDRARPVLEIFSDE